MKAVLIISIECLHNGRRIIEIRYIFVFDKPLYKRRSVLVCFLCYFDLLFNNIFTVNQFSVLVNFGIILENVVYMSESSSDYFEFVFRKSFISFDLRKCVNYLRHILHIKLVKRISVFGKLTIKVFYFTEYFSYRRTVDIISYNKLGYKFAHLLYRHRLYLRCIGKLALLHTAD